MAITVAASTSHEMNAPRCSIDRTTSTRFLVPLHTVSEVGLRPALARGYFRSSMRLSIATLQLRAARRLGTRRSRLVLRISLILARLLRIRR